VRGCRDSTSPSPSSIFHGSLSIMTGLAHWLVILRIPEGSTSAHGYDMVDNRGWFMALIEVDTERMFLEESLPVSLPPGIIATLCCRSALFVVSFPLCSLMVLAVLCTRFYEHRAAGIRAWSSWFVWQRIAMAGQAVRRIRRSRSS
jgi:hypothetical protein